MNYKVQLFTCSLWPKTIDIFQQNVCRKSSFYHYQPKRLQDCRTFSLGATRGPNPEGGGGYSHIWVMMTPFSELIFLSLDTNFHESDQNRHFGYHTSLPPPAPLPGPQPKSLPGTSLFHLPIHHCVSAQTIHARTRCYIIALNCFILSTQCMLHTVSTKVACKYYVVIDSIGMHICGEATCTSS